MAIDICLHQDLGETALQARWSMLLDVVPNASVFNTWQWCECWAGTLGRDTQPVIIEFLEDGRTVGIAPLALRSTRSGRWLELLGRRRVAGDHLDILTLPDRREDVMNTLVAALDEHLVEFDGIELGNVDCESPTLGMIQQWCDARRYSFAHRERQAVPFVSLPRTFDEYLADRSPNMRYHVRRRQRSAEKAGRHVRLIRDGCETDEAIDAYLDLHARQWNAKQAAGNFQDAVMARFLREFCQMAAAQDWLRCYVLESGEGVAGVLVAFHYRGSASFYQIAWDPGLSSASPGVVLLAASIEQAIAEGLAVYDFLQGDEQYKKRWTNESAEQITMLVGCRGAARITVVAERMKQALKMSAAQLVRTANVRELPEAATSA